MHFENQEIVVHQLIEFLDKLAISEPHDDVPVVWEFFLQFGQVLFFLLGQLCAQSIAIFLILSKIIHGFSLSFFFVSAG